MAAFSLGAEKLVFECPVDRLVLHGAGKLQRQLEFPCRIVCLIKAKKPTTGRRKLASLSLNKDDSDS